MTFFFVWLFLANAFLGLDRFFSAGCYWSRNFVDEAWRPGRWSDCMESAKKRRTPDDVNLDRWCRARKHYVKNASDVQEIESEKALRKVSSFKHFEDGHVYDFSVLKIGDRICTSCRKDAIRAHTRQPGSSPNISPRRHEPLELIAFSPVTAAATAVALQTADPLSQTCFSELIDSHPWRWQAPEIVLRELQRIPELALAFSNVSSSRQRELLSVLERPFNHMSTSLLSDSFQLRNYLFLIFLIWSSESLCISARCSGLLIHLHLDRGSALKASSMAQIVPI